MNLLAELINYKIKCYFCDTKHQDNRNLFLSKHSVLPTSSSLVRLSDPSMTCPCHHLHFSHPQQPGRCCWNRERAGHLGGATCGKRDGVNGVSSVPKWVCMRKPSADPCEVQRRNLWASDTEYVKVSDHFQFFLKQRLLPYVPQCYNGFWLSLLAIRFPIFFFLLWFAACTCFFMTLLHMCSSVLACAQTFSAIAYSVILLCRAASSH